MKTDVAIIGSGPAGTATALFLEQLGIRSIIIEKEVFPRFRIGEAMNGECGTAVRLLGLEPEMDKRKYFVKRGVHVYSPGGKEAFKVPVMSRQPTGLQPSWTWHVRRSDFDKMMLDTAIERGVNYIQGQAVAPHLTENGAIRGVSVRTKKGGLSDISAEIVVDASGPATFLSHVGVAGKKTRGNYTNQVAIYAHLTDVNCEGAAQSNTLIYYKKQHHWGWMIPLEEGVVSVGIVVPTSYFAACKESKHDFFLRESKTFNPQLSDRVNNAKLIGEVGATSNYSYHVKQFAGDGFVCVGDSHRFIDPIFSLGLNFGVAEGRMAAQTIADYLGQPDTPAPFAAYQALAESGQDVIQTLIDAFWTHPLAFGYLAHVQHVEEFIDLFAGRVYFDEPTPGLLALQSLLTKDRVLA